MRDDAPPLLDPFGRAALPAQSVDELRRDLLHREALSLWHGVALRLARSSDPDDAKAAAQLLRWFASGGRSSQLAKALGLVGRKGRHRVRLHVHDDKPRERG